MATRLYLSSNVVGMYTPATKKGAWDKSTSTAGGILSAVRMGTRKNHTANESVATNNYDVLCGTYVSDPIKADVTISGTVDAIILTAETNAAANDVLHLHIWVTQGDSDTVRGTLLTDYIDATEWAVSGTLTAFTAITIPQQALSSVSALAGDRIVVEAGYQAQNTSTSFYEGTISAGSDMSTDADGTESAVGGASSPHSWIEISSDVTFAWDYLYTTADAAPVTPAAVRGTWDIDSKVDVLLGRTGSVATGTNTVTETTTTNPTDGLIYRFVSDELAAQTIAAVAFYGVLKQVENSSAANAFGRIFAYVMASDGSNRGTLINGFTTANELGFSNFVENFISTTCSSVVCQDGDRIVIESGARFTNTVTTSYNSTITTGNVNKLNGGSTITIGNYGGAAQASPTSGWFRFDQDLLWLDEVAATDYVYELPSLAIAIGTPAPTYTHLADYEFELPSLAIQIGTPAPTYSVVAIPQGLVAGVLAIADRVSGTIEIADRIDGRLAIADRVSGEMDIV